MRSSLIPRRALVPVAASPAGRRSPVRIALRTGGLVAAAAGALAAAAGCRLLAVPVWRGPVTDHFDGRRFRNPPGAPARAMFGGVLRWALTRERGPWRRVSGAEPGPPPPSRVEGDGLRVTFVGHSTVLVQVAGLNLLTDPVWSDRVGPAGFAWAGPRRFRPPGLRFEDLPPIDAVLLSHDHYDHLDAPTLRRLARDHRHPRIFTPLGNTALLDREGVPGGEDLDWWESRELAAGVRVTVVPAQHFSIRGAFDADRVLWGAFVVSTPAGAVLFAGDTGYGAHFAAIRERLGPVRLALLPIGGFRPAWFMGPVHMSPADALRAHRDLGAATSVAIHHGTFALADDGQEEPVERLRAALEGQPDAFLVLEAGEGRDVPGK